MIDAETSHAIAGTVTRGLDRLTEADLARAIAEEAQKLGPAVPFVLKIESTLRNLGEQGQFRWLGILTG